MMKISSDIEMRMNKNIGIKAENFFIKLLNEKGITYEFIDDWYDFNILQQKVDVKSTQLSVKNTGNKSPYRIGRFNFTNQQRECVDLWYALVLRFYGEFMFLGFVHNEDIQTKYLTLHQLRQIKIYTLDEWLKKYNK